MRRIFGPMTSELAAVEEKAREALHEMLADESLDATTAIGRTAWQTACEVPISKFPDLIKSFPPLLTTVVQEKGALSGGASPAHLIQWNLFFHPSRSTRTSIEPGRARLAVKKSARLSAQFDATSVAGVAWAM